MNRQRSLFDPPDAIQPRELARRDGPETSKEAARTFVRSGQIGKHMARALAVLKKYPGSTAAELDLHADRDPEFETQARDGAVRKRLTDLRKAELAYISGETRKCAVTGRMAQVWWPTMGRGF